jgi:hypothetical protein
LESIPHEFETLAVLLVLLPGFLCARIVQALCVRPKQTEVDKVIESLLYSFVIYVCFVVISGRAIPVKVNVENTKDAKSYSVDIDRRPIFELATISVALGFLVGVDSTKDLSGKLLRWTRLSQKTTRSSIWNDVFHERRGIVQIGLGDGRRLIGWAQYYSDDPKEGSLFLQKACWISEQNEAIPIRGGGILITKESKIEYVEFLDETRTPSPTPTPES